MANKNKMDWYRSNEGVVQYCGSEAAKFLEESDRWRRMSRLEVWLMMIQDRFRLRNY